MFVCVCVLERGEGGGGGGIYLCLLSPLKQISNRFVNDLCELVDFMKVSNLWQLIGFKFPMVLEAILIISLVVLDYQRMDYELCQQDLAATWQSFMQGFLLFQCCSDIQNHNLMCP